MLQACPATSNTLQMDIIGSPNSPLFARCRQWNLVLIYFSDDSHDRIINNKDLYTTASTASPALPKQSSENTPSPCPAAQKAVLQSSTSLPTLPAVGWVRIPGIPAAQQGPTSGLGRARNAWHPHLSPSKASPGLGKGCGPLALAQQAPAAPSHSTPWVEAAGSGKVGREQRKPGMGLEWAGGGTLQRYYPSNVIAKYFQFPHLSSVLLVLKTL